MRPRVAIEIFLFNSTGDKFLMIKKNNILYLPYTLLEFSEDFEQCAQRCIQEETNILINDKQKLNFLCSFNCLDKKTDFHRIEIYYATQLSDNQLVKDECGFVWNNFDEIEKNFINCVFPVQMFFKKYNIKSNQDIIQLRAP